MQLLSNFTLAHIEAFDISFSSGQNFHVSGSGFLSETSKDLRQMKCRKSGPHCATLNKFKQAFAFGCTADCYMYIRRICQHARGEVSEGFALTSGVYL